MALADTTAPVAAAGARDAVPAGVRAPGGLPGALRRARGERDSGRCRRPLDGGSGQRAHLLPAMRDIGTRWVAGEISIAQEHFATGVLRGGC